MSRSCWLSWTGVLGGNQELELGPGLLPSVHQWVLETLFVSCLWLRLLLCPGCYGRPGSRQPSWLMLLLLWEACYRRGIGAGAHQKGIANDVSTGVASNWMDALQNERVVEGVDTQEGCADSVGHRNRQETIVVV